MTVSLRSSLSLDYFHALMLTQPTIVTTVIGARAVVVISIAGAFVFGISGGLAAIRARLDLFGVMVLSLTVGLAGGTLRDILLGDRPLGLFDWRVVLAAVVAGFVALALRNPLDRWQASIDVFDAIGLSLFCVLGTDIALQHHAGPAPAILLGVVTATGGGVVRDVLLRKIPEVLRQGLYAVPALLGSAVIAVSYQFHHSALWIYVLAAGLCLSVRLLGMYFNINLPVAPLPSSEERAT